MAEKMYDASIPPEEVYELSLSPDYVLEWGVWEAVRELLQNSIDQAAIAGSRKVFDYSAPRLTIGTTECKLEPRTLLLGVSDKQSSRVTIGQFGEGYKLAMLVLTRLSYDVVVQNNDKVWVPRFTKSERYDSYVLTVQVYPAVQPVNGVHYVIQDVSEDSFARIAENYLLDAPMNRILREDYLKGRVFVSGLFVCEIGELAYGYNFSPDRLKLDRDRRTAPTFDVTYQASCLWEADGTDAELYDNMAKGIVDVQFVTSPGRTTNQYVVDRYLSEHPDTLPVASQAELERFRGQKTRLVPAPLRDLLRRMHAFVFERHGTPSERLEGFLHAFGGRFDAEAKREYEAILEESKAWV